MEFIFDKIAERASELSNLPQGVKNWMMFMRVLFFSGLVFVPWFKPARIVVGTMILTAIGILGSKIFLPGFDTIAAGTIVQLVLWLPLSVYLIAIFRHTTISGVMTGKRWGRVHGIWLTIVTATVLLSTALNIWNVFKWPG